MGTDFKARTLSELRSRRASLSSKTALVGLDGFVDIIVTPVDLRSGPGENFRPIPTLDSFGKRISAAAGKSTNIEIYPRIEKLGGNGPIMANALMTLGSRLRYIGALGVPDLHPVFKPMAKEADSVVSLCEPGVTTALEFDDGKLMLGAMTGLEKITYAKILEAAGEGAFLESVASADLIGLVNWTMVPHMTAIFSSFVDRVLPQLPPKERIFFFDLADPEKRSDGDMEVALQTISRFQPFGRVVLGLNLKEAQHVCRLFGFSAETDTPAGLQSLARRIRQKLEISFVVVHPRESAACANREDETFWVPGPYLPKPLITTGAGDHFNAGFATGQLIGLSPLACLGTAVSCSGFYVRNGRSPTLTEVEALLESWS